MLGFVTTKKRISTVLLVIFLLIFLLSIAVYKGQMSNAAGQLQPAGDTLQRIAFIEDMGYRVNPDAAEEKKEIEIPYRFNDVYEEYQNLQLKAGYDLKKFAGCKATLYTYNLLSDGRTDLYAHLLVAKEVIIGGDISALSVTDGYMKPLAP